MNNHTRKQIKLQLNIKSNLSKFKDICHINKVKILTNLKIFQLTDFYIKLIVCCVILY